MRKMFELISPEYNGLPNDAGILCGPVNKYCLAIDQVASHRAKLSGIRGDRPVIAHHEIAVGGHHHLRQRTGIAVAERHIVFTEGLVIQPDLSVVDAEAIAGKSDHALDIALFRISGVTKDDDVVPLNRRDVIDELIDK